MRCFACFPFLLGIFTLNAQEILLISPEGESLVLHIDTEASFRDVVNNLQEKLNFEENHYILDLQTTYQAISDKKSTPATFRNYYHPINSSERKDICFIINTLGMSSLSKINKQKSSLKSAGKRIDHIHPLRFLLTIFTDEELKASMHALKDRSWMWNEFFSGLKDSLEAELNDDNIPISIIQDFAAQVGVQAELISPLISQRQWSQLISTLINQIPRNANAGRYDM